MFKVDIRLVKEDWKCIPYTITTGDALNAYMLAFAEVRRRLDMQGVDMLPLGKMEFVIWSQGKCQGFFGIYRTDDSDDDG